MSANKAYSFLLTLAAMVSQFVGALALVGLDVSLLGGMLQDMPSAERRSWIIALVLALPILLLLVLWPLAYDHFIGLSGFRFSMCKGCRTQFETWKLRCPQCGRLLPLTGVLIAGFAVYLFALPWSIIRVR
jgi:hypothetical protein